MKKILLALFLLSLSSPVFSANWCNDAGNVGCFLMEGSTTETDEGGNTSNDLSVTADDTIPQSEDKKFGTYSRDFEASETEKLYHADGNATDLSGANQNITLMGWYKPEGNDDKNETIVGKWNNQNGNKQYLIARMDSTDADKVWCLLSKDGSASTYAVGATGLDAGTWYHVACVYNDTDIRIYINGSLDSNGSSNPKSYTSGLYNGSEAFAVGGDGYTIYNYKYTYNWGDGLIDDVAVFSTALSSTDINDIMTNGLLQAVSATYYPFKQFNHGINVGVF